MTWNGFNHLLPLLCSHWCCSKLEIKTAPLWYNLPVEMETEKMNSQEGKDNKKISHSSSAKLIPWRLTKFLLLGGSGFEAWRRTSTPSGSPNYCYFIYQVSSAPLFAFSVLWDVPWAHPLSVHFGVFLGHILYLQLKACSRTQPAWLDYQSVSENKHC